MLFEVLLILAAVVLLTGSPSVIYCYIRMRRESDIDAGVPSLLRYFALAAVVGFVAYMAGSAIGIAAGCSVHNAGNLCGIWGALGLGPLLAGVALWGYGPWWRRRLAK